MDPLYRSPWLHGWRFLILVFGLSCLVYGQLYQAGFVTDFFGWLECADDTAFWQAYQCFDNRGLYHSAFAILAFLTSLFWLHPLPWFIVWTGLHAVNTFFVVDVGRKWLQTFGVQTSPWVPILAGAIFMIHPWQVEVLAWKATANYLMACLSMLLTIRFYLKWLANQKPSALFLSAGCYLIFLFALEFAIPFVIVPALLYWSVKRDEVFSRRITGLPGAIWPFLLALGFWFCANRLLLGVWIGHYGAEAHLDLDVLAMSSTIVKYLVKILFFSRLFSFAFQTQLYGYLDHWIVAFALIVLLGWAGIRVLTASKKSGMWWLRTCLLISGVFCLIPVSNLYFYYLQYSETDRYTYLAMAFFALWIPLLLWSWKKWIGRVVVTGYLLICFLATVKHVRIWEKSTEMYLHHLRTFAKPDSSRVFLLNVPDNYRGTAMFRDRGADSAFELPWKWISGSEFSGKMYDVFHYNMTGPDNDFRVTWESPNKLRVEFLHWGSWWWRNGVGAEKYSNDEYIAWPEGNGYYVEFKKPMQNVLIRYHRPDGWHDVGIGGQ